MTDYGGLTAIAFPGQGSRGEGMRESVERYRPHLLELAEELVGDDPFAHLGEGTRFDQPAIYCASLAGFDRLGRPHVMFLAGHSLGEVAALAAAGALSDEDGLRVICERGRLMQEAAEAVPGGMLAVRASLPDAERLAERSGLSVANHNSPEQVVLSGPEGGLDAAVEAAGELGVRAKRLDVAGPFHSPAMDVAVPAYREVLDEIDFREPAAQVFSCVTAKPFDDPPRRLAEALTNPVRWLDVMHALHDAGVRRFVETGPGRVLSGLVRRSLDDVTAETADSQEAAHV